MTDASVGKRKKKITDFRFPIFDVNQTIKQINMKGT